MDATADVNTPAASTPTYVGHDVAKYAISDLHAAYNIPAQATVFSGDPRYGRLRYHLLRAYLRAAEGKGAQRHANGDTWDDQIVFQIMDQHGVGFPLGQVLKKIHEANSMTDEAAVKELEDCIVYLAAAIQGIEDGMR